MKKIVIVFVLGLVMSSCKDKVPQPDGYVIDGTATGIYNGIRVHLQTTNEQGRPVTINTAIVMDEKFKFEGKLEHPEMLYISANSVTGNLPLMVENSYITLNLNKQNIIKSEVKGSKSNDIYNEFIEARNKARLDVQTSSVKLDDAKFIKDSVNIEFYSKQLRDALEHNQNFQTDFIEKYPNSFVSLFIIGAQTNLKDVDVETYESAFNKLNSELKSSKLGVQVSTKIDQIKELQRKSLALAIGKKAPDFTAPDPNGNNVSLYDIQGKVTIIDFWAAWCAPCRRENPNVVKIYNQFHDKGLEIIGVSLDGTPRQGDAKEAWLKAIDDDKLTWHHVSNLQYFNDPVARQYDINAIPATFIIDEQGTIVAKNLRGIALEQKIAELLK